MTSTTNFDAMGKEALRAACREAGISYGKLNNDGMRAALLEHHTPNGAQTDMDGSPLDNTASDEPSADERAVLEEAAYQEQASANVFGMMLNPVVPPVSAAITVTKVEDGKKVVAAEVTTHTKPDGTKAPAPILPRASSKGYTIQKDRIEQNGVKRPSEGTTCGNVWAYFDANPETKASELPAIADANTWNRTNVVCEFYNWRKFNGIRGRQTK